MHSFQEFLYYMPGWAPWLSHLLVAMLIPWTAVMLGIVVAKTGRHPAWGLLALLPYCALPLLWLAALGRWTSPRRQVPDEVVTTPDPPA